MADGCGAAGGATQPNREAREIGMLRRYLEQGIASCLQLSPRVGHGYRTLEEKVAARQGIERVDVTLPQPPRQPRLPRKQTFHHKAAAASRVSSSQSGVLTLCQIPPRAASLVPSPTTLLDRGRHSSMKGAIDVQGTLGLEMSHISYHYSFWEHRIRVEPKNFSSRVVEDIHDYKQLARWSNLGGRAWGKAIVLRQSSCCYAIQSKVGEAGAAPRRWVSTLDGRVPSICHGQVCLLEQARCWPKEQMVGRHPRMQVIVQSINRLATVSVLGVPLLHLPQRHLSGHSLLFSAVKSVELGQTNNRLLDTPLLSIECLLFDLYLPALLVTVALVYRAGGGRAKPYTDTVNGSGPRTAGVSHMSHRGKSAKTGAIGGVAAICGRNADSNFHSLYGTDNHVLVLTFHYTRQGCAKPLQNKENMLTISERPIVAEINGLQALESERALTSVSGSDGVYKHSRPSIWRFSHTFLVTV
ncbi:hypothetical protein J6590_005157 [Homalodisca vitripennis]|nr:hypothetical protein J6590_005157 [Homalodisca vitripennis]